MKGRVIYRPAPAEGYPVRRDGISTLDGSGSSWLGTDSLHFQMETAATQARRSGTGPAIFSSAAITGSRASTHSMLC